MINITVEQKQISFSVQQPKPISITVGGKPISLTVANRNVTYISSSIYGDYTHTLSQIDLDNKFITINELAIIANKSKVLVYLENSGFKFEYDVDYSINNDNQIIWAGFNLENKLIVGDIIKVYY